MTPRGKGSLIARSGSHACHPFPCLQRHRACCRTTSLAFPLCRSILIPAGACQRSGAWPHWARVGHSPLALGWSGDESQLEQVLSHCPCNLCTDSQPRQVQAVASLVAQALATPPVCRLRAWWDAIGPPWIFWMQLIRARRRNLNGLRFSRSLLCHLGEWRKRLPVEHPFQA
jgi:hypothetical protein